ncbi:MAG: C40 family peptidase [Epsilonproteobacteria bacterium]|nr:C40 family peptidase [Campylobacterota bacterium]
MTEKSWIKLQGINGYLQTISSKSKYLSQEMSLASIVQEEQAINGLLTSMIDDKLSSFQTSSNESFIYKAYQQNRYLPLSGEPKQCESPLINTIEDNAKKFLGKRYVWGAVGPKCFDCSGFTMKVFRKAGVNLPRVSRNQAKVGALVKFDELKRGDMVFFDTNRRRTGKVNHVGIYLEDGKFIHASSGKKKVVITSFDKKKFYKDRFLWGRRVLNDTMHYAFESLPNINSVKTAMLSTSYSSLKNPIQFQ